MPNISFNQKPEVAIKYLTKKHPELHFDYDDIMHEAHHKAFTVAKVTKLDLLTDIQNSLIKAREQGQTFEAWKKELIPTLKKKGWYGKTEVTNPKTGEVKEIIVGSKRLRNIFYTNTRVAYNVGRWEHQDQLEDAPYLRYVAILDNRSRPNHGKNHGIVRHKDDPFWTTNYPPNGWNCRCRVQAYSMDSLKRRGWDKGLKAPALNVADKDWAYDVRTGSRARLEGYAQKRVKSAPELLGAVVGKELLSKNKSVRQTQLDEMVEEVIVKKNLKYNRDMIEIGTLTSLIVKSISDMLGRKVDAEGIVLGKNQLLHARPERKGTYGQAFSTQEMKSIVSVIAEAKDVYVDTEHDNIMYVFDAEKKEEINIIPVELSKKVKKFGKDNYIITLGKQKKKDFEGKIKGGILKKIK